MCEDIHMCMCTYRICAGIMHRRPTILKRKEWFQLHMSDLFTCQMMVSKFVVLFHGSYSRSVCSVVNKD